jgi:hypothetical protein
VIGYLRLVIDGRVKKQPLYKRGMGGPPVSSRSVGILPTSSIPVGRCGLAAPTLSKKIHRQAAPSCGRRPKTKKPLLHRGWDLKSESVLGTFCSKFCMANVSANSSTVAVVSNRHAHSLFA